MQGDRIVIEPHHERAAGAIDQWLHEHQLPGDRPLVLTVAGESGSGKSETSAALAAEASGRGVQTLIFQQDDYFKLPPRRNDQARRQDIEWVGSDEVRLDLLDEHLQAFKDSQSTLVKPLVRYAEDQIDEERIELSGYTLAIAEGTYTSLLESADIRVFLDLDWKATRKHREKRRRHAAELDPFIERVLEVEHEIISAHKARADLIVTPYFNVLPAGDR